MTMHLLPIVLALLPVVSTFIGGYAVLRWKKDLHPWLSLSGGMLLAVAFLDLLPEGIEHGLSAGMSAMTILSFTLFAILLFHIMDKAFAFHAHHEHAHDEANEHCENDTHQKTRAWVRAGSMILHSLCDGLAIGGGFAIGTNLGIVVAMAVILHDFSDGMSTVTVLRHGLGDKHRSIMPLLVLDAIAPPIGAAIGIALAPGAAIVAALLAFFSGFFIFLALSELLPEAHARSLSKWRTVALTVLGMAIVVVMRNLAPV